MQLLDNPFAVLGASPRSTKREINERYEEMCLTKDASACASARAVLSTPKKRIAAEVRWFPGMAPRRVAEFLDRARAANATALEMLEAVDGLAYCNGAVALLAHEDLAAEVTEQLVIGLVRHSVHAKPTEVLDLINADRTAAGVSLVPDEQEIADALHEVRREFVSALMRVLDRVDRPELVLTEIVESHHAERAELPPLLEELVEAYEVEPNVRQFLMQRKGLIFTRAENLPAVAKTQKEPVFRAEVAQLQKELKEWIEVAKPIQIARASRGAEDDFSNEIIAAVRGATVEVANEAGNHLVAASIVATLNELFVYQRLRQDGLQDDLAKLNEILEDKAIAERESKEQRAAFEREVALELPIGSDHLSINVERIAYKGASMRLADIGRVRYGVYKQYINGIRTSRQFQVVVGAGAREIAIECARFMNSEEEVMARFTQVVQRVWRGVGVRLTGELLAGLSAGKVFQIGSVRIDRNGITLPVNNVFTTDVAHFGWEDLAIRDGQGSFIVSSRTNKKASAELPYFTTDNVHVLEAALRYMWKDGNYQAIQRGEFGR